MATLPTITPYNPLLGIETPRTRAPGGMAQVTLQAECRDGNIRGASASVVALDVMFQMELRRMWVEASAGIHYSRDVRELIDSGDPRWVKDGVPFPRADGLVHSWEYSSGLAGLLSGLPPDNPYDGGWDGAAHKWTDLWADSDLNSNRHDHWHAATICYCVQLPDTNINGMALRVYAAGGGAPLQQDYDGNSHRWTWMPNWTISSTIIVASKWSTKERFRIAERDDTPASSDEGLRRIDASFSDEVLDESTGVWHCEVNSYGSISIPAPAIPNGLLNRSSGATSTLGLGGAVLPSGYWGCTSMGPQNLDYIDPEWTWLCMASATLGTTEMHLRFHQDRTYDFRQDRYIGSGYLGYDYGTRHWKAVATGDRHEYWSDYPAIDSCDSTAGWTDQGCSYQYHIGTATVDGSPLPANPVFRDSADEPVPYQRASRDTWSGADSHLIVYAGDWQFSGQANASGWDNGYVNDVPMPAHDDADYDWYYGPPMSFLRHDPGPTRYQCRCINGDDILAVAYDQYDYRTYRVMLQYPREFRVGTIRLKQDNLLWAFSADDWSAENCTITAIAGGIRVAVDAHPAGTPKISRTWPANTNMPAHRFLAVDATKTGGAFDATLSAGGFTFKPVVLPDSTLCYDLCLPTIAGTSSKEIDDSPSLIELLTPYVPAGNAIPQENWSNGPVGVTAMEFILTAGATYEFKTAHGHYYVDTANGVVPSILRHTWRSSAGWKGAGSQLITPPDTYRIFELWRGGIHLANGRPGMEWASVLQHTNTETGVVVRTNFVLSALADGSAIYPADHFGCYEIDITAPAYQPAWEVADPDGLTTHWQDEQILYCREYGALWFLTPFVDTPGSAQQAEVRTDDGEHAITLRPLYDTVIANNFYGTGQDTEGNSDRIHIYGVLLVGGARDGLISRGRALPPVGAHYHESEGTAGGTLIERDTAGDGVFETLSYKPLVNVTVSAYGVSDDSAHDLRDWIRLSICGAGSGHLKRCANGHLARCADGHLAKCPG